MKKPTSPPKSLSRQSKALWKQIVSQWSLDDPAGLKVLEVGLHALDRAEECREQIDKEGCTLADRFDQVKPHPLLSVERDARSQFMHTMKQLNLDPEPESSLSISQIHRKR